LVRSSAHKLALVTGATGAIGPVLVRGLLQSDYDVRVFVRKPDHHDLPPESVTVFTGDITDRRAVKQAVAGCDVIFHLAAKLHVTNPAPSLREEYEAINVRGTRNIVDAALEHDTKRLIFFSTISVYGPTDGIQIFDEETPPSPRTIYAQSKLAAEAIALAARRSTGEPLSVVLRLAAVYGPNMKGNYQRLLGALSRGLFLPVGNGKNRRTVIYVDDVVRAALLAAQAATPGRIYNVTDGEVHTFQEIVTAISLVTEGRPPLLHLPPTPLRWLLKLTDRGFALVGRQPPISEATLDKLVEDVAVSGERIRQELGVESQVGLLQGWRKTVAATGRG
jgi:nucleoside-diphosphate-sugar epimerase